MVFGINVGATSNAKKAELEVAQAEAPKFETVHWASNPGLRKLYFWCSILCVASATTGFDGMLLNASQTMDPWQNYFGHPQGPDLGIMNSIYQIGSVCSIPLVPYVADRWGRRVPIMLGCSIMTLGAFISGFANGRGMYIGGRYLLGFGNSLAQIASPILLTEICHPQHRARVTSVYNCLWNVGAVVVAWLAWGTLQIPNDWSWRSLTVLQAFPSLIQLAFIYWVPESPRWLISKERYDEALTMLAKYHANGDRDNATVQFEWQEIKETLRLEFEAKKSSSYADFFRTKGNRYRLAILISLGIISQYSGNAIISNYSNIIYENAGIRSQNQKIPLNGGQTLLSLIVSLFCATLVDKVGRRPLFLASTAGMGLFFLGWTIIASEYERTGNVRTTGYPQIAFIWLHGICYSLAWSGLLVAYCIEILPFKLRAKGFMIMNMTVQATLVLGNQTNPVALQNLPHEWNLACFYTVWIFIELAFIYFFYIETRGPTLEELAKLIDGEEAEVAHLDMDVVEKTRATEHLDEAAGDDKYGARTTSAAV